MERLGWVVCRREGIRRQESGVWPTLPRHSLGSTFRVADDADRIEPVKSALYFLVGPAGKRLYVLCGAPHNA